MKKYLAFIVTLSLVFSLFTPFCWAEENMTSPTSTSTNVTNYVEMQIPQIPVITENMTEEEANKLIDQYNEEVDKYNEYVNAENEHRINEYNQNIQEIDAYNQEEQNKVDQNKNDLEKWNKIQERIEKDSKSQLPNQIINFNDLPSSWIDNTDAPILINVDKQESENQYHIINLHIFDKNEQPSDYIGTDVQDEEFHININSEDFLLAEWETISVGNNDIASLYCQSKLYTNSGAAFRRCLEGFYNGHWVPTQELVSTAVNIQEDWNEDGSITIVSYNEGTTDRQPIKNIFNVYVYNFVRYGEEPQKVEEYIPNFKEYPQEPELLDTLEKLDHITKPEEEQKEKEKIINIHKEKHINVSNDIDNSIHNDISNDIDRSINNDISNDIDNSVNNDINNYTYNNNNKTNNNKINNTTNETNNIKNLSNMFYNKYIYNEDFQQDSLINTLNQKTCTNNQNDNNVIANSIEKNSNNNDDKKNSFIVNNSNISNIYNHTTNNNNNNKEFSKDNFKNKSNKNNNKEDQRKKDDSKHINIINTFVKNNYYQETIKKSEPKNNWAILNAILMVIGLLLCLKFPIEKEKNGKYEFKANRISVLCAICSVLIFICTECISSNIILVDDWTPYMIGCLALEIFSGIVI